MNFAIAGTGYVGLANAVLLAQHHHVIAVDLVAEKVDKINRRVSPLADPEIEDYLAHRTLDLTATTDGAAAYRDADYVIVSTPTNYDSEKNHFDTTSVEAAIELVLSVNREAVIVIKSTVPVTQRSTGGESTAVTTSSSRRSFCGRAGRCTTTSTPAASLWARRWRTRA